MRSVTAWMTENGPSPDDLLILYPDPGKEEDYR